ncbi:NAD(P)-dependent oxidoreductase [Fibrella aquatilis]|uniref:SDR family oxidoreductase n=1 Tax=Fibrella aquatilis TaxID=2817059 RepID=A0A939G4Z9_9BACT|nr:SDR family oxidoreductase [Fibrella aquatilis]MBO0931996.1 SDR family oxidoreductase [Fibrella aquatilis]
MTTIAVFGATGRTGIPLVKQALDQGYTVKALVRNPSKMPITHKNLQLIVGDALDVSNVQQTVHDTDGVVSCLGQNKTSDPDLQTKVTRLIVEAMKQVGIRRLVSLTGGVVGDPANDKPGFIDNLIVFIMKQMAGKGAKNELMDGISHAEVVRNSGLEWTIVRAPLLTEAPAKGSYQVGHVGTVKGIKITRADLADFMLKEFAKKKYVGKMPYVTNG